MLIWYHIPGDAEVISGEISKPARRPSKNSSTNLALSNACQPLEYTFCRTPLDLSSFPIQLFKI